MPRKKKDAVDQPALLEARVSTAPCLPAIREKVKASLCPDSKTRPPS
jgi:hypothetical protein